MTIHEARLYIAAPARLLTVNAERSMNKFSRADITKKWRWTSKIEALHEHLPSYIRVKIAVAIEQTRGQLADPGAHYPVVKAVIDGLVDASVLMDDTGDSIESLTLLPPNRGQTDGVVLTIAGTIRKKEG